MTEVEMLNTHHENMMVAMWSQFLNDKGFDYMVDWARNYIHEHGAQFEPDFDDDDTIGYTEEWFVERCEQRQKKTSFCWSPHDIASYLTTIYCTAAGCEPW